MKIRKGDILYQCNSNDISDKDYCNDELLDRLTVQGLDCSSDDFDHGACPNFSKCWERPQRATMIKLKVTWVAKEKEIESNYSVACRTVDTKYNTRDALLVHDLKAYSKSERGAYRKLLSWLNKVIANVEKKTPGYLYKSKRRDLKSYISLRDRVKHRLNEIAIHKMMK